MFYIPIKLKPEPARASMTTSDVNNQWRSNFQQQIISDNMNQPASILVLPVLYTILAGIISILPESSSICNTGTYTGKY